MTRQNIQMMFSQWTVFLVFLTLMQVKRQEGHFTYRLQCKPFGHVTQAVRTNFSITLISGCEEGDDSYSCEIKYNIHTGVAADALAITTSLDGPRANTTMHEGLIIRYEWTIIKDDGRKSVMFNLTISSSDEPVTVHLTTQYQRSCMEIQDLVSIYFKGRVTQAVRTNFSVTLISDCEEGDDSHTCEIKYNIHKGVTADALSITTSLDGPRTNITMHAGLIIRYEWTIIKDDGQRSVMFNLTISSSDEPVTVHLTSQYQLNCTKIQDLGSIYFKGCGHLTEFGSISTSSEIARYLDMGHISCRNKNSLSGRAVFRNGSEAVQTQCLDDATWKDVNNITCLYPINAELSINGNLYNETVDLTYNQSAYGNNTISLNCSIKYELRSAMAKFVLNNKLLNSPTITLHPNLNRKNISCYFKNDFVKYFPQSTHTYSSTSKLNILFGPHPPNGLDSICSFPDGSIAFYSNPPATGNWLSLIKGNTKIDVDKVENSNPLYGTSDDAHVESKSNEQVMNPLYGTASSGQSDTEVYSVAYNKEEKGVNKLQEPTGDTGDLYSVVDKRKT